MQRIAVENAYDNVCFLPSESSVICEDARRVINDGARVIISRGGCYEIIKNAFDIPIVEIKVTARGWRSRVPWRFSFAGVRFPRRRTLRYERKKVEMLFAHLKSILRLDRLRLRGLNGASDEFTLAAVAQNLRRLAKLALPAIPDDGRGAPEVVKMA